VVELLDQAAIDDVGRHIAIPVEGRARDAVMDIGSEYDLDGGGRIGEDREEEEKEAHAAIILIFSTQ
jgi:hypothetical protein